jgi:hypothetical protein
MKAITSRRGKLRRRLVAGGLEQTAARRLANGQQKQRQQQAGRAGDDEYELPRAHFAQQRQTERATFAGDCRDDQAADQNGCAAADRDAHVVDAEGAAELLARKRVGDHRIRRGRQCRFADAYADARQEQLREVLRQSAQRRHQRPDDDADADDGLAVHAVGEPADRNAEQRVEDREGEALQQADLRVRHLQVALDGLHQQRNDLAVDEREYVEDQQREDQVPALPFSLIGSRGRRQRCAVLIIQATPTTICLVMAA